MTKTSLLTLVVLGLAVLVAVGQEGAVRTGILGGALFGGAMGLLAFLWLRHAVQHRPERAMRANLEGFLMVMGGLMMGLFAVLAVPAVGGRVDRAGFLLAYAALAFLPLVIGAAECAASLKSTRPAGGASPTSAEGSVS